MSLQRVENAPIKAKRVFYRIDLEKGLNPDGTIRSRTARELLNGIDLITTRGGSVIIGAHAGEAAERKIGFATAAEQLGELLGKTVPLITPAKIDAARETAASLNAGDVALLENLSHFDGEIKNQESFAKQLAGLADLYVTDAFGATIYPYASIVTLPRLLPAYTGIYFNQQHEFLTSLVTGKVRPAILILGGVIQERKFKLLQKLFTSPSKYIDAVLIGGGLSYTFLKSRANPIGRSLFDQTFAIQAFQLIEKSELQETPLLLPHDHVVADQYARGAKTKTVSEIPPQMIALDIGPKSISNFEKLLKKGATLLWYGPLGATELENFSKGSQSIAKVVAKSKARSAAIGEETVELLSRMKLDSSFDLAAESSASAWIEWMMGRPLPGIEALKEEEES